MTKIFVCSGINNSGELISSVISADSENESAEIFNKDKDFLSLKILGPFYKKREKQNFDLKNLKFSNETKKAMYKNELVNAFILNEPKNMAYLIFINNLEKNKSMIVNITELRFIK